MLSSVSSGLEVPPEVTSQQACCKRVAQGVDRHRFANLPRCTGQHDGTLPALIGKHRQEQRHFSAPHATGRLHLPTTPMSANEKANPVEVSLFSFETIAFVT